MGTLNKKVMFITGASRGIGKAIALRAARDGARIIIAAKTAEPHPRLPGTIYSAAKEIEAAGGEALPLVVDIRHEEQVDAAVSQAVEKFGGIDICVNNASAIFLAGTLSTPMKRFDLMHQVNTRGTFLTSRAVLPHLLKAENPHILNLSPPLNLEPKWFGPHCAYTIAKYGMSLCVLGMAEELKKEGVGVNALWPRTTIDTAAVRNLLGGDATASQSRKPDIVADAAHWILTQSSADCTGNFFIDETVLKESGVSDLESYSVTPGNALLDDFFV
jgi:citronellol/citronellal dehydrogenase